MSSSFVRKSFYVPLPTNQANEEDWLDWAEKDEQAARVARAKHTRSLKRERSDYAPETTVRKINGRYKQVASLGFISEGNDSFHTEPIVEAKQELTVDQVRAQLNALTSRSFSKERNKHRRVQLREARKAKYRNR